MSTKIQIAENQELVRYDNPGECVHNELFKTMLMFKRLDYLFGEAAPYCIIDKEDNNGKHFARFLHKKTKIKCEDKEHLYIFKCGSFIKVGKTNNIQKRISSLQLGNPKPITLIKVYEHVHNVSNLESNVCVALKSYHHRSEWFVYNEDSMAIIDNTVKQHKSNINKSKVDELPDIPVQLELF